MTNFIVYLKFKQIFKLVLEFNYHLDSIKFKITSFYRHLNIIN